MRLQSDDGRIVFTSYCNEHVIVLTQLDKNAKQIGVEECGMSKKAWGFLL